MDRSEGRVPSTQMCRGELGEWSECSRECGRGQLYRKFNVTQEAGENGLKCIKCTKGDEMDEEEEKGDENGCSFCA